MDIKIIFHANSKGVQIMIIFQIDKKGWNIISKHHNIWFQAQVEMDYYKRGQNS